MPTPLTLTQSFNDRLSLQAPGDDQPSVYRFGSDLPKACVHPLRTPRGHRLTGFEMSDHVWHRGLWFTIKFINGANFWEEKPGDGSYGAHINQSQPAAVLLDEHTLQITHRVRWESQATGPVIDETRTLTFHHDADVQRIDWTSTLTPLTDLTLDRTPYTTWGGYGGLSIRCAREMHKGHLLLPDGSTCEKLLGDRHDWVLLQALMDGGPDQRVAMGFIDHPDNPRTPSPWYGRVTDGPFLNAAFLFHEAMQAPAQKPLKFRYRVYYRDGHWTADEFQPLADDFRKG